MASSSSFLFVVATAILSVALVSQPVSGAKLPASFKKCKRADPKFDECIRDALKVAIGETSKGLPNFGLLPIDPLLISQLNIGRGNGPVDITLDFNDLKIHGLSKAIVESAVFDTEGLTLNAKVRVPSSVNLRGNYQIDGKVLVLPITGKGKCNLTLADLEADVQLKGEKIVKDGETYLKLNKFGFTINTNRLFVHLENLFNGDKALGDNMNNFLNENWQDILKELQPAIEAAFGATFKELANRIFLKVPFKQLFLD